MRSAAGVCLLPLEELSCDTFPKFISNFFLESFVLCSCDYLLQRERGNAFNQKPQLFKASFEAPEEISRKGERQVLMQRIGWLVFGQGD